LRQSRGPSNRDGGSCERTLGERPDRDHGDGPGQAGDPDKKLNYYLRWTDIAPLPDSIRFVTEGFIQEITANVNSTPMRVTSKRLTPDQIEFAIRPRRG